MGPTVGRAPSPDVRTRRLAWDDPAVTPPATPPAGPSMEGSSGDPGESTFIRAARGLPVSHTPVWYMRQAGRSLPEYRALRQGVGMLESCMTPDLVVEITLQPVRRYG